MPQILGAFRILARRRLYLDRGGQQTKNPCYTCQGCGRHVTSLWKQSPKKFLCRSCATAAGIEICTPQQKELNFKGQLPAFVACEEEVSSNG